MLIGIAVIAWSCVKEETRNKTLDRARAIPGIATLATTLMQNHGRGRLVQLLNTATLARWMGTLLVALGVLLQDGGAPWFFAILAIAILVLLVFRPTMELAASSKLWIQRAAEQHKSKKEATDANSSTDSGGAATTTTILLPLLFSSTFCSITVAGENDFEAADTITQQWQIKHQNSRLSASGSIMLTGRPGDPFLLLRSPAVLTDFDGEGLRLTKRDLPDRGPTYILSIPVTRDLGEADADPDPHEFSVPLQFQATFAYQL